jgi:hypothetical protein
MSNSLTKQPSEDILFDIDFEGRFVDRINAGVPTTINSVISITDNLSALTFGTPAINGYVVQVSIGGGVDGVDYKITIKISTDKDAVIEEDVYLAVVER